MIKAKLVWVGLFTLALLSISINTQNITQSDCSSSPNSYWTGYRCACRVGFKNESNVCVRLTLLKTQGWIVREPAIISNQTQYTNEPTQNETVLVNTNCYLPFEFFNGQGCVCLDGYARINGLCQATGAPTNNNTRPNGTVTCPANSVLTNGTCVCNTGFTRVNDLCIQSSRCGANSYDNGLGFCVCNTGFHRVNGTCVAGTPCPPSSTRNAQGTCVCDAGLTLYGDYCARCPLGAIFDNATKKCVFVCGQNSAYDATQQRCLCLSGYGILNKVCAKCPANYFIQNNHCVTCPVNADYNSTSRRCECQDGFLLSRDGVCIKKCANNEVYNSKSGNCDCFAGLGRVNGVCQICPTGTTPGAEGNCSACGVNQQLVDGQCICSPGFIPNQLRICTRCSEVSGAFVINGACAVCPGDLTYNGQRCGCPAGFIKVGTKCREACKNDELVDDNGICYECQVNEVISNGRCVCRANYIRNNSTGVCELSCPAPQFRYQGRCAQCPLNLQYRSEIRGCACADGLYINNFGVCERVPVVPVTCDAGFFFDTARGCVACPAGCRTCSSATVCTACTQTGFTVVNGACRAVCGDGVIAGSEQCDDRNTAGNDGCSATCTVENLWACTGQPSVCTYNGPAICGNGRVERDEQCDDGNLVNGDGCNNRCQRESTPTPGSNSSGSSNSTTPVARGLTLVGNVNTNINNVFIVLKTDKPYTFTNENEMESFLKTRFPDSTSIPSVYCSQREAPELDTFDCLAIYSSGIPNQRYRIEFSFNYQGDSGFISVQVDPLASSFATRARGQGAGRT